MKNIHIVTFFIFLFALPIANAQPTGLSGFYGQASVGLGSANFKRSTAKTEEGIADTESAKFGESAVAGSVALGYNYSFSNGFNLGTNVFYNIRNSSAGGTADYEGADAENTNAKLQNLWGISVEPGYSFTKDSLGYLKLGWAQASSSVQTNKITSTERTLTNINFGNSNGFLYGLGYKHLINKNTFIGVEFYQVLFGSKSRSVVDADAKAGDPPTIEKSTPTYTYAGLVLGIKF